MVKITIEFDDGGKPEQYEAEHFYLVIQEDHQSWCAHNPGVSIAHKPNGWTFGQFTRFSREFMDSLKEHVDELDERYEHIVVRPEPAQEGSILIPGLFKR